MLRTESLEGHAAVRGHHVLGVVKILHRDRDPQERPCRTPLAGRVCGLGLFNRVGCDELVRVESELTLVVELDPVQIRLRNLLRGRDARLHVGAQLADGLADDVILHVRRRLHFLRHRRLHDLERLLIRARRRAFGVVEAVGRQRGCVEVVD